MPLTYQAAGVDYGPLDDFKRACQRDAVDRGNYGFLLLDFVGEHSCYTATRLRAHRRCPRRPPVFLQLALKRSRLGLQSHSDRTRGPCEVARTEVRMQRK